MIPIEAIKVDIPFARDCFGCSKTNPHGLQLEFYYQNNIIYTSFQPNSYHSGWGNIVHGGISATICDESLAWLSICTCHAMAVTKDLSFEYHLPIETDQTITAITKIENIEKNKRLIASSQVYNDKEKLCVSAKAKMLLVSPKAAKRLNIMSDEAIDQFNQFLNALTTH